MGNVLDHVDLFLDLAADLSDKVPEVVDGKAMDVGGIVPGMWMCFANGHSAAYEVLQGDFPMAEIRKRNDGLAPYPKHFPYDAVRVHQLLQCPAQDNVFIGAIRKSLEPLVQVKRHDPDPAFDAPDYLFLVQFHATTFNVLFVPKPLKERAGTAPKVKDARSGRDQVNDNVEPNLELVKRSANFSNFFRHRSEIPVLFVS
jgi:hypothetical protein